MMLFRSLISASSFLGNRNIKAHLQWRKIKINTLCRPMRCTFTLNTQCLTVGESIKQWARRFKEQSIPEPVESIEHIIAHVIGTKKIIDLLNVYDQQLTSNQCSKLELLCECRLSRMPVQYIIGEWDFRNINLKLTPPIFIPRPETELLVDFVLKRLDSSKGKEHKIIEVGCGSGAISLAIAHTNKTVKCIAIDTNQQACELTEQNRDRLGLRDQVTVIHATLKDNGRIEPSDMLNGAETFDLNSRSFDFIVSNPPYISTKQIFTLTPEIKIYEDITALDGGEDGLKIIKPLLKYAAAALKPGGRLFLEVDSTHPEYIIFFTKKYSDLKLQYEHTHKDFSNMNRFVEILKIS